MGDSMSQVKNTPVTPEKMKSPSHNIQRFNTYKTTGLPVVRLNSFLIAVP